MPTATTIRPTCFPVDLNDVVAIFREYVASPTVSLDFQDSEREFAGLPGKYAEPEGCILLALDVLPEFVAAQQLYASLGFKPAAAVSHNPIPGTQFLALELG